MATVAQVLKRSLKLIVVGAADAPVEPDEAADYIFDMNAWMLAQDALGIHIGYTKVSDLTDVLTVPDGALLGIITNMAIQVAPDYSATISPGLAKGAKEGLAAMMRLGSVILPMSFPDTLPIGSGNDQRWFGTFFPGELDTILAEIGGSILLESETLAAAS